MSRIAKQFLYGTLYLSIIGALVWGIYSITLKPAPSCFDNFQNGDETGIDCGGSCVSCEIKNLQPLFVGAPVLLGDDRAYTAVAELQNSNYSFGARTFSYTVNFYDQTGTLLKSVDNKAFIYPGQIKNIMEAGVRIFNGIPASVKIELDPASVVWVKPVDFAEPKYEARDLAAVFEGSQVAISGLVSNPNNFPFSKVIVSAFTVDKLGVKMGASRTELYNVGQFRQENFKIFIPIRKDLLNDVDLKSSAESVSVEVLK